MPKKRRRPRARFYVFLAVLALAIWLIVTLIVRSSGGTVVAGSLVFEEPFSAVVIRDEQVVTAETYGKITFYAAEGERVTSGAKIAEVYKWGYNDSILQDLLTLQQQIKSYQVGTILADIVNPDLESIETQITGKKEQIRTAVQEGAGDVLVLERELKTLMENRRDYLKNNLQPDDQLTTLYEREQVLLDRLESWKQDVLSVGAGMVSFYFDGYESALNRSTLTQITATDIRSVLRGAAAPGVTSVSGEKPLYRVVNTGQWYLAFITDKKATSQYVGEETYTVVLDGFYDKPYEAKVIGLIESDAGILNILQIDDDASTFVSTRTLSGTAQRKFDGLCVPTRAIATVEGQTGVYIRYETGEKTFVPVEILHQDRDTAVFRCIDGQAQITAGMQFAIG